MNRQSQLDAGADKDLPKQWGAEALGAVGPKCSLERASCPLHLSYARPSGKPKVFQPGIGIEPIAGSMALLMCAQGRVMACRYSCDIRSWEVSG